jgi:hypothetical protein
VPPGIVLGPLLHLLYTADLTITADSTTATFIDDTAVLTAHEDPALATHGLQTNLNKNQLLFKKWRMKVNETNSVQAIFTVKKNTCPPVELNNKQLTQTEEVKYLGIRVHLDRKHTWRKHIRTMRKQLDLKLRKL